MSDTVFLHIGIAKTGTTYLQRTLFASRHRLARHGVLYPGADQAAHFFASLDLRSATFKGYADERVPGSWERIVRQADAFHGATLISHETLAHAKPDVIEHAVGSFAADDVEVIVTCRDLVRQLPAMWQESVKNRGVGEFEDYAERVLDTWEPSRRGSGYGFWTTQDVGALVARWSEVVGPERVWVVTVPPRGADAGELLHRFAQAARLPDVEFVTPDEEANTSLGVAEAELLRRLNSRLHQELDWPHYEAQVKRHLVETALAGADSWGRLSLHAEWLPRIAEISAAQRQALEASGAQIVGDLSDLTGDPEPEGRMPADLSADELLEVALDVLARLAREPLPRRPAGQAVRSIVEQRSVRGVARAVREVGSHALRHRRHT